MSPKQKRAIAAILLAALAGSLAAFAPGVKCDLPDEQTVEDLIPDESDSSGSSGSPATIVAPGSDSPGGSSSDGSSSGG